MKGTPPIEIIIPHAKDEFGTLETTIVSGLSEPKFLAKEMGITAEEVRSCMKEVPMSCTQRLTQHLAFSDLLQEEGVRLIYPHHPHLSLDTHPNALDVMGRDPYCRDFIGVIDDVSFHTNQQEWRMDEKMYYESILKGIPPEKNRKINEQFSWGNALLDKEELLVGELADKSLWELLQESSFECRVMIHQLFDAQRRGVDRIRETCSRRIVMISLSDHTDLDFAIAPLPQKAGEKRTVLVQDDFMTPESLDTLGKRFDTIIPIPDPKDALGTNLLWINPQTVVIAEEAASTAKLLESLHFDVRRLPMWAIWKKWDDGTDSPGGWRCMTAPLQRKNDA